MKVLVTGAAGYIGSHALKRLRQEGHDVVALDDLRRGHVGALLGVELIEASVHDRPRVEREMRARGVEAVMHFAASCYVGESVERPLEYYENNVVGTLRLAEACVAAGVGTFVLSSTAATYGEPDVVPIPEETPRRPVNPYGRSKAMAEDLLTDCAAASSLRPIFLRYFNAAGADPDGELGEDHDPETHLVPNAIRAALGRAPWMRIFGDDYDTPDGTCVRDYVHVTDLAQAHVRALDFAAAGGSCRAFNLGCGSGYSVKQVVDTVREVTGRDFDVAIEGRRAGDPPTLVAASARARDELGWRPEHESLREIVETAWRWLEAHPNGYA
ncbi:MAG: UDP-glucose 4-epimerase GalE [Planctomycetota bacterium JB042]